MRVFLTLLVVWATLPPVACEALCIELAAQPGCECEKPEVEAGCEGCHEDGTFLASQAPDRTELPKPEFVSLAVGVVSPSMGTARAKAPPPWPAGLRSPYARANPPLLR